MRVRIGTRPSPLAMRQAEIIASGIRECEVTIVPITTTGDRNMSTFAADGVKGMFTREIEASLFSGEIDIAVHSLKDLPIDMNPELPIVAYSKRGNPFDALITGDNDGNVIGTSSLRRRLQAERLYPSCEVLPVRGNVGTRLRKLDAGEYSGLILSVCGLERLGLSSRITRIFTADEIMPASCQGIIACQGRAGEYYDYLSGVNDEISRDCAISERSFSRCLGTGCNIPAGAYAEISGDILTLKGLYIDGGKFYRGEISGNRKDAAKIGERLAHDIYSRSRAGGHGINDAEGLRGTEAGRGGDI